MPQTIAVYPGSFDPITYGHMDIIARGCKLFDRVIVALVNNPSKSYLFDTERRLDMLKKSLGHQPNIEFDAFDGLLVDYVREKNARFVVRGIRAFTDFEFELQMALMNKRLSDEFETVFLMPSEEYLYVSSRLIKEIARLKGDVSELVHPYVAGKLEETFGD